MPLIWNLGFRHIAGTHRQLCITDYKYRYAAGKIIFNWLAHQACTHIFGEFSSQKGTCPKWASDRRSPLAWHESILALGIQATDFSDPAVDSHFGSG